MNLDSFIGPGSTPSRRRFWDKVTLAVIASQKIQGENVSVEEHQGMGTLIGVPNPTRRPTGATGACCSPECECSVTTEADCATSGGTWTAGINCAGSPCGTCPDPDSPTLTVVFSGITKCDDCFITCDLNGTFVLDNIGTGEWFLDTCFDGETFLRGIHVTCSGGNLTVADTQSPQAFSNGTFCPPTVANTLTCDGGDCGEGGTATVSVP